MPDVSDKIPFPYDEDKDPDKFWFKDLADNAMPKQKGFITDLVYFMRGMEVPTLFTIWSGLWLLSTCIKREAWIKWYPNDQYGNLYVILTGPAGSRKSTTIDEIGIKIVKSMQQFIQDKNIQQMKNINIIKDKMTPESLLNSMLPENKPGKQAFIFTDTEGNPLLDKHNRPIRYKATSETGVVLSEMASSIGKRSYTDGFVEILLDLYNPRDTWDWTTMARSKQTLKRTYLSLLAATTPSGFKNSVPQAAMGDGFLSRCILVYQDKNNRVFSIPRIVKNGPTMTELSERLAWICENTLGEFSLSDEAFARYDSWYRDFRDYLEATPEEQGFKSRMNINVLKVAFLLRANRYDTSDKLISLADVEDSINLLTYTYAKSAELLLSMSSTELQKHIARIESYLNKHGETTRRELLRVTHIPAYELSIALDHMNQEGLIIIKRNKKVCGFPTKDGNETYTLNMEEEEENNKCQD